MSNTDNTIIKQVNEYKNKISGNIYDGFNIKGEKVEFTPYDFLDNKLRVWLPKEFVDIPEWLLKVKYPSENRPKVLKMHPDGGMDFGFNILELTVDSNQVVNNLAKQMVYVTKQMSPSNIFIDTENEEVKGKSVSWYDFISYVVDGRMYNMNFLMPLDGKVLHAIFNCSVDVMELWKPVVLEVFREMVDLKEEENK